MTQLLRSPTTRERLRTRIRTTFMKQEEIEHMKSVIIRDAKPLYVSARLPPRDWEDRLAISCFEERIETLPKETLLNVYSAVKQLRSARSAEAKKLLAEHLLTMLSLSYSIEGWFREKIVQYAIASGRREYAIHALF